MKGVTWCCLILFGLMALLLQCRPSMAQEAGLYGYTPAVRFEESPGYFHYILECQDGAGPASTNVTGMEPALCWSVVAAHFQVIDGKIDEKTSNPTTVNGVLRISKSHVSFVPKEPGPANPERRFEPSDVALQHQAGQATGFVARLVAAKVSSINLGWWPYVLSAPQPHLSQTPRKLASWMRNLR